MQAPAPAAGQPQGPTAIQRLANDSLPLEERIKACQELRGLLSDPNSTPTEQAQWLHGSIAACCGVLRSVAPRFEDDAGHRLRYACLEYLGRLPSNETLRAYMPQTFEACLAVLQTDNQENALCAVKLMFDLVKAYKQHMEPQCTQFVNTIIQLFREAPTLVRQQLEGDALTTPPAQPPAPQSIPGLKSFRLMHELTMPVTLMLQIYPKLSATYLELGVAIMYELIRLPGPEQARTPPALQGLANELRMAQVKALQFVAHVARQKSAQKQTIKTPMPGIGDATLHLMKVCPDTIAARKELIVAARSMMNASPTFNEALRQNLDELLDGSALLGKPGSAARSGVGAEALRSSAYQMIVELIHYARKAMAPAQMSRCVATLSVLVSSPTVTPQIHILCCRVLVSFTECCFPLAKQPAVDIGSKAAARGLLTRIMQVLVSITKGLQAQVHPMLAGAKAERAQLEAQRKALATQHGSLAVAAMAARAPARPRGPLSPASPAPAPPQTAAGAPAAGALSAAGATSAGAEGAVAPGDGVVAAGAGAGGPDSGAGSSVAGSGAGTPEAVGSVAAATGVVPAARQSRGGEGGGATAPAGPPYLSLMQSPGEKEKELGEAKQIVAIILSGLRGLLYAMANFTKQHQQAMVVASLPPGTPLPAVLPPGPPELPPGFTTEELRLLSRLWLYSLRCLPLMWHDGDPKETCGKFIESFSPQDPRSRTLDPREFTEVFYPRLGSLFGALLEDPELMLAVTHLLAPGADKLASPLGRAFAYHALEHMLTTKLGLLERLSSKEGAMALKLIKVLLVSLPTMPDLESTFAPLLASCVERCIPAIVAAREPGGYLQLLRSIFKAALHAGQKPRLLQAELEPHLNACLNLFTAMLDGPNPGDNRNLLMELCLTLPILLDALPAALPRLVHPLLLALTTGPDDMQHLGLRTLEVWVDGCSPEVVEAAASGVMPDLSLALWALLKHNNPLASRALIILGKLGGRNRRWLSQPLKLEYKDNPEYGLRLILTFQPAMSFLTPLDKCMALAKASMLSPTTLPGTDPAHDLYYRQQALRFLQVSLASVMTLRSIDEGPAPAPPGSPAAPGAAPDAAAPGAASGAAPVLANGGGDVEMAPAFALPALAAAAAEVPVMPPGLAAAAGVGEAAAGAEAGAEGAAAAGAAGAGGVTAVDSLLEVLLGKGPVPTVLAIPAKSEQGVKTKTQLLAERAVLVTLVSAVIAASAEDKLGETAAPFARDICRHFAMLFAAGTQGLRELDIYLFLDALLDVLCDKVARRARAALDGMGIFLDTLLLLKEAKEKLQEKQHATEQQEAAAAAAGAGEAAAAMRTSGSGAAAAGASGADGVVKIEGGAAPMEGVEGAAGAAGSGGDVAAAAAAPAVKEPPAPQISLGKPLGSSALDLGGAASTLGLPPVLDSLYTRLLHCCTDDSWQARLAGAAAVKLLVHTARLPPAYLQAWAAPTVRALLGVVKRLPDHAVVELQEVEATLASFLGKVLKGEQPPPVKHKHTELNLPDPAPPAAGGGHVAAGFVAPPADGDVVRGMSDVLLATIISPQSPPKMRSAAASAVLLLANATGTTPSQLMSAYMAASSREDVKDITTRRLLPLKSVAVAMGCAAALEYCCRLSPPVVTWGENLALVLGDAMTIVETTDSALKDQLPRSSPPTAEALTSLRVACMNLICGVISLEGFRDQELKQDDGAAAGTAAGGAAGTGTAGTGTAGAGTPVPEAAGTPPLASGAGTPAAVAPAAAVAPDANGNGAAGALAGRVSGNGGGGSAGGAAAAAGDAAAAPTAAAAASASPAGAAAAAAAPAAVAVAAAADGAAPAAAVAAAGAVVPAATGAGPMEGIAVAPPPVPVPEAKVDSGLKRRLTLLLLNALAAPNPAIWSAAKSAVEAMLTAQAKVSKITLQQGLRPLLQNLGDHRKLTLPMLQGLSRLLEMLSEWFSVSLGVKLLEHLQKWTTPEGPMNRGGQVNWRPGEEAQVATAMLDLFHLLPRQAAQFLETNVEANRMGLVVLTIELEERLDALRLPVPLPRTSHSPYRPPLTRFLNKYASEAVNYFLDQTRICVDRYLTRLLDILRGTSVDTSPLLAALTAPATADKLVALLAMGSFAPATSGVLDAAPFNTVALVSRAAKLVPGWLTSTPALVAALRARWASPERLSRLTSEEFLAHRELLESKRLAKALLTHVSSAKAEATSVLLDLMSMLQVRTVVNFSFLERYCSATIPSTWGDLDIRALLGAVTAAYASGAYPQEQMERIMQVLVNPVLSKCLEAGRLGVLDLTTVDMMLRLMLGLLPQTANTKEESVPDTTAGLGDGLQVELLKLATCILQHAPHLVSAAHHKQLITWAWRHLKRENSVVVSHALLATAVYLTINISPENIVMQVFNSMLRNPSHAQLELKRPVVRQALDVLMPVLIARKYVVPADNPAPGSPAQWYKFVKKALEDAGSQSAFIWQLMLKQAHCLYPYRALFVTSISQTAVKLVMTTAGNIELKRLALDLVALMVGWEEEAAKVAVVLGETEQQLQQQASGQQQQITGQKRARESSTAGSDGGSAAAGADGSSAGPSGAPAAKAIKTEADASASQGGGAGAPDAAAPASGSGGGEVAAPLANALSTLAGMPSGILAPSVGAAGAEAGAAGGAGGAAGAGAGRVSGGGAPDTAPAWRFSQPLQDQLCSLLLRLVLQPGVTESSASSSAGSGGRDDDQALLQQSALNLLSRAVVVWSNANVKASYIERTLPNAMVQAAAVAPPPAPGQLGPSCVPPPLMLTTALTLLKALLNTGSYHMLKSAHTQVCGLVEPCGQTKSWPAVKDLCGLVRAVLAWPPVPGQPNPLPEVTVVAQALEGVLRRHLAFAGADLGPEGGPATSLGANPQVLSQLCCCLALLEEVAPLLPANTVTDLVPLLVRVLIRTTKEVAAVAQHAGGSGAAAARRGLPATPATPPARQSTAHWAGR